MRLKEKGVLITGAGTGIGYGCAKLFSKEGAKVVINDLNPETGQAAADEINKAGGTATFLQGDMSKQEDQEKLIKFAIETLGTLDIVVNSAGMEIVKKVCDQTEEDMLKMLNINVMSLFTISKHAVTQMRKQGNGGSIVNLASVAGLVGIPWLTGYCTSKHAVVGLTKSMAKELRDENIRVNCICPAFIDTTMGNRALGRYRDAGMDVDSFLGMMQGRLGKIEEVANAALFLASDESSYVTGTTFAVDNALTAG